MVGFSNGTVVADAAQISTITQNSLLVGGSSNSLQSLGTATNGQIAIGSTGNAPVLATLTAGTGISITNASGSITVNSTGGGHTWTTTSANVANMSANTGYFCISPGGALTLGLPTTSALGDAIRVNLAGATSWQITQGAGQQIGLGSTSTTLGAGGSLTSTAQGDSIQIVCRVANLRWEAVSVIGNITVV